MIEDQKRLLAPAFPFMEDDFGWLQKNLQFPRRDFITPVPISCNQPEEDEEGGESRHQASISYEHLLPPPLKQGLFKDTWY